MFTLATQHSVSQCSVHDRTAVIAVRVLIESGGGGAPIEYVCTCVSHVVSSFMGLRTSVERWFCRNLRSICVPATRKQIWCPLLSWLHEQILCCCCFCCCCCWCCFYLLSWICFASLSVVEVLLHLHDARFHVTWRDASQARTCRNVAVVGAIFMLLV